MDDNIRLDNPEVLRDIRDLRRLSRDLRAVLDERTTGIWNVLPGVEDSFYEGCYCLCAIQNPAVRTAEAVQWMRGWDAYGKLGRSGEADDAVRAEIAAGIRRLVRFHNVKAGRIVLLRRQIGCIHAWLAAADPGETPALRDRLTREIKGFGFKEASHFLRNVGFRGLTIPDVHILRRLSSLGLVEGGGGSVTVKVYREADAAMRRYADALGANLDELDALWWSRGSGSFGR